MTGVAPGTTGRTVPGVLLAVAVAAVVTALDRLLAGAVGPLGPPYPGAPVLALLAGLLVGAVVRVRAPARLAAAVPGLRWSGSRVLQAGIVVLGLTVPLTALLQVGARALPVVAAVVPTALLTAHLVGRAVGVPPHLRLLVGAGTGVCGASAVAATAAVVRPRDADVSYALAVVVALNLVGVVLLPAAALLLGLEDAQVGAWVGAAVNDTSAVVAVAGGWSAAALAVATVVKLTRVLALVPLTAVLAWRHRDVVGTDAPRRRTAGVPGFVVLFVLAVGLAATGLLPAGSAAVASVVVTVLLTVALAAVGLATDLGEVRRAGPGPLLVGAAAWSAVVVVGLALVVLLLR